MNLIYEIPNKLYYIQNFLDYPTYKKIHYDFFKNKEINLNCTKDVWQETLKHGHSNFVKNVLINMSYKPLQKIKILLQNNPFHKIKYQKFRFHNYSMNSGSGINWHNDGNYEYGITYYINSRWNRKFGGEFMFVDENKNGFIPIKGNSILIIKTPLFHKVVPVMKSTVPRKTIQIFVDK